jgi:hypothetical protein
VSAATVAIDRRAQTLVPVSLTGSPNSARMLLSAAATSMMTLITLVLTVTTVTVQLAMGQFSPRIVRALLHDRQSQLSHGLFLATFGYALLGIREVENVAEGKDGVPGVTVVVAYGLVLASIVTLLLYVNHASDALRVAGLIDLVGDEVRRNVDRAYPAPPDRPAVADDPLVYSPEPGVLVDWDVDGLVEVATSSRPAGRCSGSTTAPARWLSPRTGCAGSSRWAPSGCTARTRHTASGSWSTSPNEPWTRRSTTRRPRYRPSTGSTTACASWLPGRSRRGTTRIGTAGCGSSSRR